jgi:hypothetical protein
LRKQTPYRSEERAPGPCLVGSGAPVVLRCAKPYSVSANRAGLHLGALFRLASATVAATTTRSTASGAAVGQSSSGKPQQSKLPVITATTRHISNRNSSMVSRAAAPRCRRYSSVSTATFKAWATWLPPQFQRHRQIYVEPGSKHIRQASLAGVYFVESKSLIRSSFEHKESFSDTIFTIQSKTTLKCVKQVDRLSLCL